MLKINGIVSLLQHPELSMPLRPARESEKYPLLSEKGYHQNPKYHENSANELHLQALLPKAISTSSIVLENLFIKRSVKDREKAQKNDSSIQMGITSTARSHCPGMIDDKTKFKLFLIHPKMPDQGEPCRS